MEIIALKYGESQLCDAMVFQGGQKDKYHNIPFIMYLVKTGSRKILVDAGCDTMPGFEMKNFIGPVAALEKEGLKPDDITDVIITHSHHDHIACVGKYKNAVIHIQSDEYAQGKKIIPDNAKLNIFHDGYTLTKAIKIIKIGGHTKGSCVVEIARGNRCFVIAGDECYSHRCITEEIPTGASICIEKSMEFIKKYAADRYTILFCHDETVLGEA